MYIYPFKNCNGVTRVLTEHYRHNPCRPGMAVCSRDVVRGMHGTKAVYSRSRHKRAREDSLDADFHGLAII